MASQSILPSRALEQAYIALNHGDKPAARHWAQIAASLAPDLEEPWLILAAVSRPHASIAYLEKVLATHPESKRARAGLVWAHQQHALRQPETTRRSIPASIQVRQPARINATAPTAPTTQSAHKSPSRAVTGLKISIPILLLLLAACLIAAWAFWPAAGSSVSAAILGNTGSAQDSQILSLLPAGLLKPSDTPLPTGTSLPTSTPTASASPTPLPTDTATPTPQPTDTATPAPTSTATPLPPNTPQPTAVPQAAVPQVPAGGRKLIVVSISQQHVYAYQGGTLVYSFIASTGSGNSTRTGTFSILDKIPKAYASSWNFWMPDWMGIYYAGDLEDGFHSLPLLANGNRLWGDSLGTPVTYGCIVLGIQDSKTLYNWAEIGTTVQINR